MKYYIITGEASGDLHRTNLVKEIKLDPDAKIRGWGGDLLKGGGVNVISIIRTIILWGFGNYHQFENYFKKYFIL